METTDKKKLWTAIGVGILLAFMLARGCSSNKPQPQVEETQAAPAELPELEQNKIYMTNNATAIPEPTEKFEEVPDDNEKISDEESKLITPLKD